MGHGLGTELQLHAMMEQQIGSQQGQVLLGSHGQEKLFGRKWINMKTVEVSVRNLRVTC